MNRTSKGITSLTFTRDAKMLRELTADPLTSEAADLELMLRQPITLSMEGTTVLKEARVSLYYFACAGQEALGTLKLTKHVELEIPEGSLKLTFDLRESKVMAVEDLYGRRGSANFNELLSAWESFSDEARIYLMGEFPDLVDHREVGGWFRRDSDWRRPPSPYH